MAIGLLRYHAKVLGGGVHSKAGMSALLTFENHCLEQEIDFWRPLRRLWRGTCTETASRRSASRESTYPPPKSIRTLTSARKLTPGNPDVSRVRLLLAGTIPVTYIIYYIYICMIGTRRVTHIIHIVGTKPVTYIIYEKLYIL